MVNGGKRGERWWAARYANSQRRIDEANRNAADELPIPHVPALSTLTGADGSQIRLRLIPPGEPLDKVGRFAVAATLGLFLSRGTYVHRASNSSWIAVAERQRGPWRSLDRLDVQHFDRYSDAARFLQEARGKLEAERP